MILFIHVNFIFRVELSVGTGGWTAGPFYTFDPRHSSFIECREANDGDDIMEIDFTLPDELENVPIHLRVRFDIQFCSTLSKIYPERLLLNSPFLVAKISHLIDITASCTSTGELLQNIAATRIRYVFADVDAAIGILFRSTSSD